MTRAITSREKSIWLVSGLVLLTSAQCLLLTPEAPDALDTRVFKPWSNFEWWFRPVEVNRFLRLPRVPENLHSVFFLPNTGTGWTVGDYGRILHTSNAGRTWDVQQSPVYKTLTGVAFADRDNGWIVGGDGTVLRTRNGGQLWELTHNPRTEANLDAILWTDSKTGWIAGDRLYDTSNAGATWNAHDFSGQKILNISFHDARVGWINAGGREIFETSDRGNSWHLLPGGTLGTISGIDCEGEAKGFYIDDGLYDIGFHVPGEQTNPIPVPYGLSGGWPDRVFIPEFARPRTLSNHRFAFSRRSAWTHQNRKGWEQINTRVWRLRDGTCPTSTNCWLVGDAGTIIASTDGANTWFRQTLGSFQTPFVYTGSTGNEKWLLPDEGDSQTIHTSDGSHWSVLTDGPRILNASILLSQNRPEITSIVHAVYSRYPAPFYWTLLLLAALVSAQSLRPTAPEKAATIRLADDSVADAPIAAESEDLLNRLPIARQLSALMRNTATVPPFVVSINGPWGSGKSSLMRMLHAGLRRAGLRAVWFNAWHQGDSETLAANLLEAIRDQAPAWNLPFRLRLFAQRGYDRWLPSLFAVAAAGGIFGSIYWARGDIVTTFRSDFSSFPKDTPQLLHQFRWLGFPFGMYLIWRSLSKGLEAFGVNLSLLAAQTAAPFRIQKLKPKAEVLEQFRREFADVVSALGDQRLAIFVDDIDRCHPDAIAEVMKSINFVTNCGPCFFILGLARETVIPCLGLAFEKVALERALALGKTLKTDSEKAAARQTYAEDFLRKIINLEIDLPLLQNDQVSGILGRAPASPPSNLALIARPLARLLASAKPLVVLFSVLLASVLLSWFLQQPPYIASSALAVAIVPPDQQPPRHPDKKNLSKKPEVADKKNLSKKPEVAAPLNGAYHPAPYRWCYVQIASIPGFILLLLLLLRFLRERPQRTTTDSPDYRSAVVLLSSCILEARRTPREIKRFLNTLRYIASRPPPVPQPRWRSWLSRKQSSAPSEPTSIPESKSAPSEPTSIPESKLVVMAALRPSSPALAEIQDNFAKQKLAFPEPADWENFDAHCRRLGISPDTLRIGVQSDTPSN